MTTGSVSRRHVLAPGDLPVDLGLDLRRADPEAAPPRIPTIFMGVGERAHGHDPGETGRRDANHAVVDRRLDRAAARWRATACQPVAAATH